MFTTHEMCHPGDKVKSRFKTTAAADSPIAEFSKCHEWWTTGSESPGVLGAKEAANKWKLQDMKYYTAYTGWNGGQKVTPELDQGSDWVVTWQYGCTQGTVDASTTADAYKSAAVARCGVPSQIGNSALKVVPEVSTIGASAIHQIGICLLGKKSAFRAAKIDELKP